MGTRWNDGGDTFATDPLQGVNLNGGKSGGAGGGSSGGSGSGCNLLLGLVGLIAGALILGSCAIDDPSEGSVRTGELVAEIVKLPDDRAVMCVYMSARERRGQGGVSCDWRRAE